MTNIVDKYSNREEYKILYEDQISYKPLQRIKNLSNAKGADSDAISNTEPINGVTLERIVKQDFIPKPPPSKINGQNYISGSMPSSPSRVNNAQTNNKIPNGFASQRRLTSHAIKVLKENAKQNLLIHNANISIIHKENLEKERLGLDSIAPIFEITQIDKVKPEAYLQRPKSPTKIRSRPGSRPTVAVTSRNRTPSSRQRSRSSGTFENVLTYQNTVNVTPERHTPSTRQHKLGWEIPSMDRFQAKSKPSTRRNSGQKEKTFNEFMITDRPKSSMLLSGAIKRGHTLLRTERGSTPLNKARTLLSYRSITPAGLTPRRSPTNLENKPTGTDPSAVA